MADFVSGARTERNSALRSGLLLLAAVIAAAVFGPLFVRDPLERTLITEINGQLRGTPFPPFQTWQFPLGSDRFGRDLWARLLHAIRPTLLLVLLIGSVRLVVGVLIGVAAGWFRGTAGRISNGLLNAALSVPVLLTALAGITAIGIERGLPAFLVGMALTGWADTAALVRTQTQRLAAMPFIEAARALGANPLQLIIRHVSRHIAPLLLMLLAAELSATMLLTAALSFLGYFIGGGVWVITAGELIPIASRVAGPPELGQLVGTAPRTLSIAPPWEMIFPSMVMILTTFSFAQLAEGLRRAAGRQLPTTSRWSGAVARLEQRAVTLSGRPAVVRTMRLLPLIVLVLALLPWLSSLRLNSAPDTAVQRGALPARAQPWQSERGDAAGTRWAATLPATVQPAITINLPITPVGSPVIDTDGRIIVAGSDGYLLLLAPDGTLLQQITLSAAAAGAPALGSDGTIYVATRDGALSAFAADGSERWRFSSRYRAEASSGPVVAADGTISYAILDAVQAVNPDGSERWLAADRSLPYVELAPRLSPDGTLVFLRNKVFRSSDGAQLVIEPIADEPVFAEPTFLVGVDGELYYRSEHRMIPWRLSDNVLTLDPARSWPAGSVLFYPRESGVAADGTSWWIYSTDYADTRLVWSDSGSNLRGERLIALRNAQLIAVDNQAAVLICGRGNGTVCATYDPGSGDQARWTQRLSGSAAVTGGAVVEDRIYLLRENGELVILSAAP